MHAVAKAHLLDSSAFKSRYITQNRPAPTRARSGHGTPASQLCRPPDRHETLHLQIRPAASVCPCGLKNRSFCLHAAAGRAVLLTFARGLSPPATVHCAPPNTLARYLQPVGAAPSELAAWLFSYAGGPGGAQLRRGRVWRVRLHCAGVCCGELRCTAGCSQLCCLVARRAGVVCSASV